MTIEDMNFPPDDPEPVKKLPQKKGLSKKALNIIRVVVMLAVIALTIVLLIYRDQIQVLQAYGYPGIFLFSILANATVLVPIPGVIFTSAMGAVFNPFWVAIAAGAGAALGELSGYLAGFSGQAVVENAKRYDQVVHGGDDGRNPQNARLEISDLLRDRQDPQDDDVCLCRGMGDGAGEPAVLDLIPGGNIG